MTLPSAEQTSPTALSWNADSWLSIPKFLGASHVSSNDPDDLMQDVPELAFLNDLIESNICLIPNFVHGLHATQLEPVQDSSQAITPLQPPLNHMSSLNNKGKSKSNTCTPATNTHLSGATNRVKGSARIGKTKKYSGASASVVRKRARERKAHLFQAFAPLEKAKKALKSYSKSSRHFRQKSESLFLQLEKLIDKAICSDDASDSFSISEASDLEADSAYESFSDMPLSEASSSVFEEQDVHLGRQATAPSSIQNLELHLDEETPRPVQPWPPIYSCTYGPEDERCPYATSRKSDWIRHEESEKHWPQKRYMCMLCAETQSDEDSNPCCTYCSLAFSTIDEVHSHSLNCIEARRKGKTFTGAKTDHFQAHLVDVHHCLGLDKTSAAWTYNHKTKWPRYCGFCTYQFKDWEERKHHVAEHFKTGADISNWNPSLHNPRRETEDEPGSPPRNDDDDDDDDDDHSHQHDRGKYSAYEATQSTYSTTGSDNSGSFDLSINGYLDWDYNEGGWDRYNIEYEERCSNSLESCLNCLGKGRQKMKRYIPVYERCVPYVSGLIRIPDFTGNDALNYESTNAVSRAFQDSTVLQTVQTGTSYMNGLDTKPWNHLLESTTGLETIDGAYVRPEDKSHRNISLEGMISKMETTQVAYQLQSPRYFYSSFPHSSYSRERGKSSKWLQQWRKVHPKRDRKLCFESRWKHCTECDEPCTREDSLRNHRVLDRMHHLRDHLKSHHRRVADSVNLLLSGVIFDNQSKLCSHVPAKEWKIRRVLKTSYSGPLHQHPEEYEDESLLISSDTIFWGDRGNYIFDPPNCFLNNKQTCGPGQRLQENFSEYTRHRIYRAMGHSCKREPDCPNHQRCEEQHLLWPIFELWECGRASEEQLTWMIEPNFKPFGITSDRPKYQKAKSGFPQSLALERYLCDYDLSEHLAYLAFQHISGDARSASNAPIGCLLLTSSGAALCLQIQQKVWVCLFKFPGELNIEHTVKDRRQRFDGQDVDTHLLLGGVRAFESGRTTFLNDNEISVLEESDGNGEHLE